MTRFFRPFLCGAALLLGITLTACSSPQPSSSEAAGFTENGKLRVSVTFDAMKAFVQAVGGDRVQISTIIPDGTEPHDFEPKAQDLTNLHSADLFVYSGMGMEFWAPQAARSAQNPRLVVVEAAKGIPPIFSDGAKAEKSQEDPHVWLSIRGAEAQTRNICAGLVRAAPQERTYWEHNRDAFIGKLEALYRQYHRAFQANAKKTFVTGHAAFAYFCRDFGLQQNSVEDVFAEGEPSAKQLIKLIAYCRQHRVKTIFAEELASPEVSRILAQEAGANVETIYTMESTEGGKSYLERMKSNLQKVAASLQ